MDEITLTADEVEELTAAMREGAAAIVKAWNVLTKIGKRTNYDWEPEGNAVRDWMEFFASGMTIPEDVTPAAVKEAFSRPQDWTKNS